MAPRRKTGGKDFKPGQSGNPNGRPKTGVPQARKMGANQFSVIVEKYMDYTLDQIQMAFTNPSTPSIDLIVLKILHEAIKKGDSARLAFLLERTIGKVKDVIDHNVSGPATIIFEEEAKKLE